MVRNAYSPQLSPGMIRFALLLLVALAGTLCAPAARAQVSTDDLASRVDRLEAALRDLTGTIEQLQYRNQQLEQEVRRLEAAGQGADGSPLASAPPPPPPPGAPYSAPAPIAATAPATIAAAAPIEQPPAAAPSGGRRADVFDPTLNPGAPGAPRPLGISTAANEPPPPYEPPAAAPGAPLDLSARSAPGAALPGPPPRTPSATGAMQATLPPSNTPRDEYDLAYGYVLHRDYGLAADTFRAFLRRYPSDRMAPEAQYWLGESLFQQQQYREAAESFLAVSTKYETTARAPEALLRLGQSLAALGEKEAACASLGEVLRKYPRAALNIRQSVEREQKRVRC